MPLGFFFFFSSFASGAAGPTMAENNNKQEFHTNYLVNALSRINSTLLMGKPRHACREEDMRVPINLAGFGS